MNLSARAVLIAVSVAFMAGCSNVSNPVSPSNATALSSGTLAGPVLASGSGSGGGTGGGGGVGGGGGGGTVPPSCVAEISSFSNTPGYGPYGPNVADIRTRLTVKNCTGAAVSWQARATYTGPFWGGSVFSFPLTCALAIGAGSSATCQLTERYLLIQQTYTVTVDVLDASDNVMATTSASVATPSVPNPAAT